MMAEWRSGLSLSESEIAMTVVSYFAGCVLTLFFLARLVGVDQQRVVKLGYDVGICHLQRESAILYAREVEKLLDHALKTPGLMGYDLHALAVGLLVVAGFQGLAPALYCCERSPQLVGYRRYEIVLLSPRSSPARPPCR